MAHEQSIGTHQDQFPYSRPVWVEYMTIVSHWLLILNSSCNILIYLWKDPKFKAILWEMVLTFFRIPHANQIARQNELEDSQVAAATAAAAATTGGPGTASIRLKSFKTSSRVKALDRKFRRTVHVYLCFCRIQEIAGTTKVSWRF